MAFCISFFEITHDIRIGEVEIIPILISLEPSILNIFDATPDSDFIPAPIIETLAIFSSLSEPSAFKSSVSFESMFTTSPFCSSGAVKLMSVF